MIDDYLNTFDGIFFNVEKYEPVKLAIDQVGAVLSSIITRYGEIENEISCGTSRQDDFIDTVICLFVRKIMEQLDAINVLYSVGSFTQAQVILRALIENIVSMEFILETKNPAFSMLSSVKCRNSQEINDFSTLSDTPFYPLFQSRKYLQCCFHSNPEGYRKSTVRLDNC